MPRDFLPPTRGTAPPPPPVPPRVDVFTPERLARDRAAEQSTPGTPPPAPAGATPAARARQVGRADPLSGLEALNPGAWRRPLLPTADALDAYDPPLATMLRAVQVATSESVADALAAQSAQYGGAGWQAALEATADALYAHLDECPDPGADTLPPLPRASSTVLRRHLTEVAPDLLTNAYLSQARVTWADDRARTHARHAEQTHALVRQARDDLEAQIVARWESARTSRDRLDYEGGKRLSPPWAQANALLRWLDNPDLAYAPPRASVYPGDLEYLEYQADLATGGLERTSPPIPPAEKQELDRYYQGKR